MFFQCWSTVYDAGPTLNRHWVKVSCSWDSRNHMCTCIPPWWYTVSVDLWWWIDPSNVLYSYQTRRPAGPAVVSSGQPHGNTGGHLCPSHGTYIPHVALDNQSVHCMYIIDLHVLYIATNTNILNKHVDGPALKQHWVNVSCLLCSFNKQGDNTILFRIVWCRRKNWGHWPCRAVPSFVRLGGWGWIKSHKCHSFSHRWRNAGSAWKTTAQYCTNAGFRCSHLDFRRVYGRAYYILWGRGGAYTHYM